MPAGLQRRQALATTHSSSAISGSAFAGHYVRRDLRLMVSDPAPIGSTFLLLRWALAIRRRRTQMPSRAMANWERGGTDAPVQPVFNATRPPFLTAVGGVVEPRQSEGGRGLPESDRIGWCSERWIGGIAGCAARSAARLVTLEPLR